MNRGRGNNSTSPRCRARRRLSFSECEDGGPSEFPRRAPINQSYTTQRGTVSPAQNVRTRGESHDRTFANYSDVDSSGITHGTYSVVNPEFIFQVPTYNDFASGLQSDVRSTPWSRPQQSVCRVNNSTFYPPRNVCPLSASQRSRRSPQAQFTAPSRQICPSPTSYSPQRLRPQLRRQENFDFGDECDMSINNSRRERSNVSRSNRTASGNIPNFSVASPRNEPVLLDISHRLLENSYSREPASTDEVSISLLSNRDSLHVDLNNINDILNDENFVDGLIADLSQRSVDNSNRSNRPRSPRNLPANRSFGRNPQRDLGDGFGRQDNRANQMENIQYRNFQNVRRQMVNESLRDFEDGLRVRNMSPSANQRGQRNLHDESNLEQRGQRRDYEDGLVGYRSPRANQGGQRRISEDGYRRGPRNLHDESDVEQRGRRNLHDESDLEDIPLCQRGLRRDLEDGLAMGNMSPQANRRGQRNLHDESNLEQRGQRRDFEDGLVGDMRNLHDQSDQEQGGARNLHDQSDQEQGGRRNLHDQSDQEQGGRRNLHDQSDLEQGGPRNLHDQSDQEQGGRRNLHDESDQEQGGPRNLHDQSDLEQGGARNLHDQSDQEQGGRRNLHDESDQEQGGRRNLHDESDQEQGGPRNLHDESDQEQGGPRNLHDESDLEQGGPRNLHDESGLDDIPLCQRGLRRDLEDGLAAENVSPRANQRDRRNLHDESDLEGRRGRVPQGDPRQGAGNVSIDARMYRVMSPAANQRRLRFEEQDEDGLVPRNMQLMSPQANQRRCRFEEPGPSGMAMQNRQVYMSPPGNQRRQRNICPISPANQRSPRYIPENRLENDLGFENADISEEMLDDMIEDLIEDISLQLENLQPAPENVSLSPPRRAANMSLSPPREAANVSLSPPRQARNIPASPPRQPVCISCPPRQAPYNRSLAQGRSPPGNRAGPSQNEYPTNEQLISNLLRASANASGIAIPPPTGSPQRDFENLVAHGALDELTMSLVNISLSEDIISGSDALLEHVSELSFINISTENGEQQQISILNESIRPPQNANMSSLLGESPRMLEDESPLCSLNQGGDEILRLEGADQEPWRVAVQYSPDGELSAEENNSFRRVIEDLDDRYQSPRSPRTPSKSSTPKKP